jgi:hypothetical protein
MGVTLMFEDGSGSFYLNMSETPSELLLVSMKDRRQVARLRISFPESDVMRLEGPFDEQEVRMTLRKVPTQQKPYVFRSRGFQWVQEKPFNP